MTRLERIQVIKLELLLQTGNPPSGSKRHPLILLCAAMEWSSTPMRESAAGRRPRADDSVLGCCIDNHNVWTWLQSICTWTLVKCRASRVALVMRR